MSWLFKAWFFFRSRWLFVAPTSDVMRSKDKILLSDLTRLIGLRWPDTVFRHPLQLSCYAAWNQSIIKWPQPFGIILMNSVHNILYKTWWCTIWRSLLDCCFSCLVLFNNQRLFYKLMPNCWPTEGFLGGEQMLFLSSSSGHFLLADMTSAVIQRQVVSRFGKSALSSLCAGLSFIRATSPPVILSSTEKHNWCPVSSRTLWERHKGATQEPRWPCC